MKALYKYLRDLRSFSAAGCMLFALALLAPCIARAQVVVIPWEDIDTTGATAADVGAVDPTRTINTTAPLTGGGDLSADRTLAISAATTSATGVVELGTQTEIDEGDSDTVPTGETLQGYVNPLFAARATGGGLYFNGTSGARVYATGIDLGASDLFVRCKFIVESSAPSTNRGLISLSPSSTSAGSSAGSTLNSHITALDTLVVQLAAGSGNYRQLKVDNFTATYGGKIVDFVFTRAGTTVAIFINGEVVDTTETSAGTAPAWSSDVESDFVLIGTLGTALERIGAVIEAEYGNVALTASEVSALNQFGWGALPHYYHSSGDAGNTLISDTVNNGNFETSGSGIGLGGTTDFSNWWAGSSTSTAIETSDPYAGSQSMRFTGAGPITSNNLYWLRPLAINTDQIDTISIGAKYRISFAAKHVSGGGSLQVGQSYGVDFGVNSGDAADWSVFSYVSTAGTNKRFGIFAASVNGAVWLIDNVTIEPIGLCGRWLFGRNTGYQVPDLSGANNPLLRSATGTQFLTAPQRRGQLTGTLSWTATHEAKAFPADQAAIPANAVIESIIVTSSASTTGSGLSIGDGDTTSYWTAVAAHTAGTPKYETLANRFPASSAAADLKFYFDPDTANITTTLNITINYSLK